jgi:hypothetical protein
LLCEERGRKAAHERAGGGAARGGALCRLSEPLLGRCFKLCGDRRRSAEPERARRPVDLVGLAPQLLERVDVVPRGDEALDQLGDQAQLVTRSLQVPFPHAGGEPEVVVLGHGLQDITSFIFGL